MKKIIIILSFCYTISPFCQEKKEKYANIEIDYFYGNVLKHNNSVGNLLLGHPSGFILSYNNKATGNKTWQHRYDYPDFGISFSYQDYKNPTLGEFYSIYGHTNFYLRPRANKNQLILRTGFGVGYVTNPYDKVKNPRNLAFGTNINASVYIRLYYKRENLIGRIGVNAGFSILHGSNASLQSPNTGINVIAATLGLNYNLTTENEIVFIPSEEEKEYKQPLKYNFEVRFGASEVEFIGSGIKPVIEFSALVDKRINRKSALQFGSELLLNYSLKNYIDISSISNESFKKSDFKRVGIFLGHELFVGKSSLVTQVGYYVYYPFELEGKLYERVGLKRYLDDKWFVSINLKLHLFKAENATLGVGIRL